MFTKSIIYLIIPIVLLMNACAVKDISSGAKPIDHKEFTVLLQKYVNNDGWVDYNGLIQDSIKFHQYLQKLSSSHPDPKTWTVNQQKAYWINAYNAFTLKLVCDHYPVSSIKDIKNGIPFVNTVWDIKFIKIQDQVYDLNNIEHGILRPKFKDPRVHFAVNCASFSCPALRSEAYEAATLDAQLDDQAARFINDPKKNMLDAEHPKLSKIFYWYSSDFTEKMSKIEFINQWAKTKINTDASLDYLDYIWSLNKQ